MQAQFLCLCCCPIVRLMSIMKPHAERIAAILSRPGMNKVLLAELARVHRNTLEGCELESWNPQKRTFDKIMAAVRRLERAFNTKEGTR